MKRILGLMLVALFIAASFATPVLAGDEGAEFVFAPAPITDPVEAGEKSGRFAFSFVNVDAGATDVTLYGLNLTNREGGDVGDPGKSLTGNVMFGGDDDDTMDILSVNVGANLEGGSDPMSVPFFGFTFGFTTVSADFADTFIMNYGLLGGYQHHIEMQSNVYLTPYVTYGWQGFDGTVDPDSGDSIDIDGSTTTLTLGLDISFNGISLATLLQSGEEDVTQIQVGFNY